MWTHARHLLEMVRFSHTLFALPFALLSAFMAWNLNARSEPPVPFRWTQLLGILVCMVFARSAAMSFNRLADRQIDARNPRTRVRHLPAGTLSVASVTSFALLCVVGFVAGTLLFLPNRWPLWLSVPVLLFLFAYSYTKRFTAWAHFWLGAALMLAPVATWLAIRAELAWAPIVLGGALLLWVAGFDIIYACQDFEFDRAAGLHSVPVRLGIRGGLRLSAACHFGMLVLLALLPVVYPFFDRYYWFGLAAVAGLLCYEHWVVRPDDLDRINLAFFHVNWIIGFILLAVGTADLLI